MSLLATVIDVFVDRDDDHGTATGIVWASSRTRKHEHEITADLGIHEAIFIDGVNDGVATARVFTSSMERRFSVASSVALAGWLRDAGDEIRSIDVPAGSVRVRADDDDAVFVTAMPEWVPEFELAQLSTPAEVDAVDPDAFGTGRHYVWAWADESAGEVRARLFIPDDGLREAQAGGSAAMRLSSELARDLRIREGAGSLLATHVRYLGQQVEVGGRVARPREVEL